MDAMAFILHVQNWLAQSMNIIEEPNVGQPQIDARPPQRKRCLCCTKRTRYYCNSGNLARTTVKQCCRNIFSPCAMATLSPVDVTIAKSEEK
jgi:hypothetical protein